ncbi:hypothetical protein VitviT2T_014490 [Vitis vinifera]|uniref:Uncharacterized protein n=1 Tax=Vitis vinifera TaxID=29760 RepID=A0ABY9CKQ0_VITVI|nr:hypothetical protein VitviT2T_014490 [Vitis vinifera]
MAAPIRAGFPTRAVADKGKALTTDPQHPTERGLPLVQLSVKIRRSKKELSYVAAIFAITQQSQSAASVLASVDKIENILRVVVDQADL